MNADRVRAVALVMLWSWLLAACEGGDAPAVAQHPWLTAPPPAGQASVVLPPFLVFPVAPAVTAEAVHELHAQPWIQLSPGSAAHYAGHALRIPAEMRPFLVRAVAPPKATVEVVQSAAGLWLRSRGGDPRAALAAPRVVLVDPTPAAIFVTVEADAAAATQERAPGG